MSALWKVSGAPSVSSGLGGPRHGAGLSLRSEAEARVPELGGTWGDFFQECVGRISLLLRLSLYFKITVRLLLRCEQTSSSTDQPRILAA